jgi:uncharacterized protein involved in exopolysaccharide biosynthesis
MEADVLDVLTMIARRWRLIFGGFVVVTVTTFVLLLLVPNEYTTQTTFIPSSKGAPNLGALGSLALSFGVIPPGETGPKFYADLAKSDEILLKVLGSQGDSGDDGRLSSHAEYVVINHIRGRDSLALRDATLRHLRRHVEVDFDPRTSVVVLRVTARDRALAVDIAWTILRALNDFNIHTLQTAARAQREFLERRVTAARRELALSQDSLRDFYTHNRRYQESPGLVLRESGLRRTYELRQQNLVTLLNALEQARIDEVRDTPVLTTLDRPILPAKKSGPKRGLLAVGTGFVWLALSVFGVSLRAAFTELAAQRPVEIAALRSEWREVKSLASFVGRRKHGD